MEAYMSSGSPDAKKRACYDCRFCRAAVTWWCMNKTARHRRQTGIPNAINCLDWEPVPLKSEVSLLKRLTMIPIDGIPATPEAP